MKKKKKKVRSKRVNLYFERYQICCNFMLKETLSFNLVILVKMQIKDNIVNTKINWILRTNEVCKENAMHT